MTRTDKRHYFLIRLLMKTSNKTDVLLKFLFQYSSIFKYQKRICAVKIVPRIVYKHFFIVVLLIMPSTSIVDSVFHGDTMSMPVFWDANFYLGSNVSEKHTDFILRTEVLKWRLVFFGNIGIYTEVHIGLLFRRPSSIIY